MSRTTLDERVAALEKQVGALPDPSVQADEEAVLQAFLAGTPVDPEVAHRVQERGRLIGEEAFRKHGLVDIAVPTIRELRGPLP